MNTINQLDQNVICGIFHTTTEYMFSSSTHAIIKIDHILGLKQVSINFKKLKSYRVCSLKNKDPKFFTTKSPQGWSQDFIAKVQTLFSLEPESTVKNSMKENPSRVFYLKKLNIFFSSSTLVSLT